MLQSIQQCYGRQLSGSDGEIGHLKDFFFDTPAWAIRYLMANTDSWLNRRQILISPLSIESHDLSIRHIKVNLKRKQVESGPTLDLHKPVTRAFEAELFAHYSLPPYWPDDATGVPSETEIAPNPLRSTRSVHGYHFEASHGIVGHVSDFLLNTDTWFIEKLVIRTGHRLSGREITVDPSRIERFNPKDSTLHTSMTAQEVENCPEYRETVIPNPAQPTQP